MFILCVPPGGCGLPLAYVLTEEAKGSVIDGIADRESREDLMSEASKGGIRRDAGVENVRVAAARRTSEDFATFIVRND